MEEQRVCTVGHLAMAVTISRNCRNGKLLIRKSFSIYFVSISRDIPWKDSILFSGFATAAIPAWRNFGSLSSTSVRRRSPPAQYRPTHPGMELALRSVADPDANPDPSDPYVFGPPGSGSESFYHQAIIVRKLWFLLFCDFFFTFYL